MGIQKSLKYWVFLILVCLGFGHPEAHARQDLVPGSRYTSARGSALGDAFLPLGEDGASGLFYNPADIGKLNGTHVEPLNLGITVNSNYIANIDRNFYKITSLSGFQPTLANHIGSYFGGGGAFLPTFYTRGFAFGMLIQNQFIAAQNSNGTVTYKSLYQFIPTLATGVRLAGGIVRLGYSLQWVNEAVGNVTVNPTTSPLGYNQGLSQGSAFSHNVGAALTLPVSYLPSLNFVARNLLQAKYGSTSLISFAKNANGTPAAEPTSFDASLSVQPKTGRGTYVNMVAELRDITNTSRMALLGRVAGGLEFVFRDKFYLRGGWGSGYPAAGIGLKNKSGEFSFSWYSEEVGSYYHALRDVRYMIQYQVLAF